MFALIISSACSLLLLSIYVAKASPQPPIAAPNMLVEMENTDNGDDFESFIAKLPEEADTIFNSLSSLLDERPKSIVFSNAQNADDKKPLVASSQDPSTFTQEFRELSKTVGIEQQVADVKSAISDIHHIINAKDGEAKKLASAKFLQNYESNYRNLADSVFDDFVRKDTNKTLNIVRKLTKEYRQKVQEFGMGLAELALQGAQIEVTYAQLKDKNDEKTKTVRNKWVDRIKEVRNELNYADLATKDAYNFQHAQDYQDFMKRNANLPLQTLSIQLFEFMEKKYNWRYWAVVIFQSNAAYQMASNYCNGNFDNRGKYIVTYASQDKNINNFSVLKATNLINNSEARSFDQAWKIRDNLTAQSGGCNNYALIWVACVNCGQYNYYFRWHKGRNLESFVVAENDRHYDVLLFG